MGLSPTVHEFVEWSEGQRQQAANRALRVQLLLAALIATIAIIAAIVVMKANFAANEAEQKATVEKAKTQIEIARTLISDGRGMDALALSASAASSGLLPKDSADAMRAALKLIGGADWDGRPNAPITSMALSSNGTRMVTVSPSELCFWDVASGALLPPCKAPPKAISSQQNVTWIGATISSRGTWVVGTTAATTDASSPSFSAFSRRDLTRTVYRTDSGVEDKPLNAALSDARTRLLAQRSPQQVRTPGGKGSKGPPLQDTNWVSFSPDEKILVVTPSARTENTYLYDTGSGKYRCTIPGLAGSEPLYVTRSGISITTDKEGWHLWSVGCRSVAVLKGKSSAPFVSVADDEQGRLVAISSMFEQSVRLFDLQALHERDPLPLPLSALQGFRRIMLSPDGSRLIAFDSGRLMTFDIASRKQVGDVPGLRPGTLLDPLIVTPRTRNGTTVLQIMNVFSGKTQSRPIQTDEPDTFAGDQEGRHLAVLYGGVVHVFDLNVPPKEYERMGGADLLREACYQLRNQPENVRAVCK